MQNDNGIAARDAMAEDETNWISLHKGILFDYVEQKLVLDALNCQQGDTVLDVGCGTGRFTRELVKHCRKVYACDTSPRCIEVLTKSLNNRNVEAFVHDMTLPLPGYCPINKIVSMQALQHIASEARRQNAIRNLYNRLSPGGLCVVTVYNAHNRTIYTGPKEYILPNGVTYAKYYCNELTSLFREAGFKDIKISGIVNFLGYRYMNQWNLHRILKPMALLDVLLSKLPLSQLTGALLLIKGKKQA